MLNHQTPNSTLTRMELSEVMRLFRKVLKIPPHSIADVSIRKLVRLLDPDRSGEVDIDELFVFLVPPDSEASSSLAPPLSPERRVRRAYQTSPQKARDKQTMAAANKLHEHEHEAATDEAGSPPHPDRSSSSRTSYSRTATFPSPPHHLTQGLQRRRKMEAAMMRIDVKFDDIMRRAGRIISPSSKRRGGSSPNASPSASAGTDLHESFGHSQSPSSRSGSLSPSGRRGSPTRIVYAEERGVHDPGWTIGKKFDGEFERVADLAAMPSPRRDFSVELNYSIDGSLDGRVVGDAAHRSPRDLASEVLHSAAFESMVKQVVAERGRAANAKAKELEAKLDEVTGLLQAVQGTAEEAVQLEGVRDPAKLFQAMVSMHQRAIIAEAKLEARTKAEAQAEAEVQADVEARASWKEPKELHRRGIGGWDAKMRGSGRGGRRRIEWAKPLPSTRVWTS
mmetsp:Transcript_33278/g.56964  ORF Transcript_33278/g.56964 Transcript_33278/m.56964 type:complete len:451 (+) Transcript_33278:93-1445(+)